MKWMAFVSILLVVPLAATAANTQVSSQDHNWLVSAHQTNLSEIHSGQLAAQSGHSEAVRDAGRMLATDHANLDAKLKPVAQQLGVKLPDQPNAKQRREMKKFKGLSGTQFDRTWAHDEAGGHVMAIQATEKEINHGSDPQVTQLAQSALPVLKKHLQTLRAASARQSGSE